MKTTDFSSELNRRMDPWWRKARIAARLLLKKEARQKWNARDKRLAGKLADDPGVTNRLMRSSAWSHTPAQGLVSSIVRTAGTRGSSQVPGPLHEDREAFNRATLDFLLRQRAA